MCYKGVYRAAPTTPGLLIIALVELLVATSSCNPLLLNKPVTPLITYYLASVQLYLGLAEALFLYCEKI